MKIKMHDGGRRLFNYHAELIRQWQSFMIEHPIYLPCCFIQVSHHCMECTMTCGMNIVQCTDMSIVNVKICVSGEINGLMNSCMPFTDGRKQLVYLLA
jgi:hypothetical protein